ncbi:glycosyltransferase family 4 protein [Vicingus serpentipes]|uniref:Glycosyltransferase family 4 protein n=1 Tax=Vicingus serpentipes TaxID=1926625 RepID=A0A5C6RZY6_9FLAO|nr:glycosyltransferase [Vicingus serpentipes]TXB67279.1 glycosyltransferase family 4 protein [Vicingus serpentipes]
MKVLYITYDGLTDPLGQSQVLPYVIGLAKKGHDFTILSCDKPINYQKNNSLIQKICDTNNIKWESVKYSNKIPVISSVWNILKLNIKTKKLITTHQYKILHCRSYLSSLIGLAFKQKVNIKLIFDMRGFWADERIEGGIWGLNNPIFNKIYNYFKKKEIEFIKYSDQIISLTETGKTEILAWNINNINPNKIQVIPCAADYKLFTLNSIDKKKIAKQNLMLNENTFVVSYIGSIGTWYLLDEMLEFYSYLKTTKSDCKFLFLTPDDKQIILNHGEKYGLTPNDFIVKFSPRADLPKYASASDISIFFIKPSFSKKASSPTKMGELMAMGIPIICNNNVGDVELIINKTKSGYCLNDFSPDSYKIAIEQINNLMNINPSEIREKSKEFYDLEKGITLYNDVYEKLSS